MAVSQSMSHPPAAQWHAQLNGVISVLILLVITPPQLAHGYSSKATDCSRWISCYLFLWGMFSHGKGKMGPASIHLLHLSIFHKSQRCCQKKKALKKKKNTKKVSWNPSPSLQNIFKWLSLHCVKELALNILNWKALRTHITNTMPRTKCDMNTNWISNQPTQVWWSWILLWELLCVCLW